MIELLVVIAIIGILASVVLAATNNARTKGYDAATIADLDNMRAQAELFYSNNNAYSSATIATYPSTGCAVANSVFTDATITTAIAAITTSAGTAPVCGNSGTNGAKATGWAMSAVTRAGPSTWCVDSTGYSGAGKVATTGVCA